MSFDVVFLGSSPNALVAATRLAKAGRRVLVLEPRAALGGAVATSEFAPGFRADAGVMSATLDPQIAHALHVHVDAVRRPSVTALGPKPATLHAMPDLGAPFNHAVELLRSLYRSEPVDVQAGGVGDLGARLVALGPRDMHEVLRLSFMSARDFFAEHVSSEPVRALLAGAAVRGLNGGPFAQGTLFGFLHHAAIDDAWHRSSALGGLAGFAETLATAARAAGAEIRTGVGPLRVEVEGGVARGARAGDELIAAARVVSDFDARTTFTSLVSPRELDPEDNRAIRLLRDRGSVARVHLALSRLPEIAGLDAEALRGTLVLAPDVASIERAWDEAKRGVASSRPYVELTLPTLSDSSLAPEGRHVVDAWVQYVPYGRGDRQAVVKSVLDQLAPLAPGLPDLVLHHHVSLPEDLERRFDLAGGQLYGGEIRLDQAFFLRPLAGRSRYETPIENLYLGGSAAHPGGYGGHAGWNLATRLLSGA